MSPRLRATVDASKWPRVYITWPSGVLEDEDFEAAVDAMSALNKRGERYVCIHDARRAARPTPKQRAYAAEAQKRDTETTRRLLRGVVIVTASPLIAGVLTAVNWISPAPYPQKTCSTLTAAETWATDQLAKHDR